MVRFVMKGEEGVGITCGEVLKASANGQVVRGRTRRTILKAAVMKYGKNQWARISSLLVRKTPKQCKARWYEWLDPSIKKTEWTREEEEKLLQLAKLKPCQWRTIAPMIGRTPAQCLEHFEKLMDAAQSREAAAPEQKNDPRKLRAGEIDPNPEMKPARPDPVDMDEDEKEMLSEARARLANTRGKKAKRKAREKQLEEARRLAFLQKKRELKAAGIESRNRRRRVKEGIDYLHEIPFEKRAPKGEYDTSDDRVRAVQLKNERTGFMGKTRDELDGVRRDVVEERERKKDRKRLKLYKEAKLPEAIEQISRLTDPERINRRSKLILPAPQMTEKELEEIAKLGGVASAAAAAAASDASANTATNALLGNFQATPMATPMRTPLPKSSVLDEARKLAALSASQTPLLGGPSTPLPGDFGGVTPKHMGMSTPNVLATSLREGRTTPAHYSVFGSTPQSTASSPVDEKQERLSRKRKLLAGLMELPAPQQEYGVEVPSLPAAAPQSEDVKMAVDVEDAKAEARARKLAEEQSNLRKQSLVVQSQLPRPKSVNREMILFPLPGDVSGAVKECFRAMNNEMLGLVNYDIEHHSTNGQQPPTPIPGVELEKIPESAITAARRLITAEVDHLMAQNAGPSEILHRVYDQMQRDLIYVPSAGKFQKYSSLGKADKLAALQHQFSMIASKLEEENARAKKLEAKIDILTFGYRKREQKLSDDLVEVGLDLEEAESNHDAYEMLAQQEIAAVPLRVQKLKQDVAVVKEREAALQRRYANLMLEKQKLMKT